MILKLSFNSQAEAWGLAAEEQNQKKKEFKSRLKEIEVGLRCAAVLAHQDKELKLI